MGVTHLSWAISSDPKCRYQFRKRTFDLLCILLAAPLLLPILLIISLLVRIKIGSPVLFTQERPGVQEDPFLIYKFRTMTEECDQEGNLLPDGERLKPLGCLLRRTSLDELPELYNVLKGDMSLVGPRPLLMRYLPYYSRKERIRHQVLPGITGWAQINGRNLVAWDERLAMDIWYVENRSTLLDLKILFATFHKVIGREGVSADTAEVETDLDQERAEKGLRPYTF